MSHPNLTITVVIEYNNAFLLILRGSHEENYPSHWAFPGGRAEKGETGIETARREVKEETGLSITDQGRILDTYCFGNTVGWALLVRAQSNEVSISDEAEDYCWISTLDDLNKYKHIDGIEYHLQRAIEVIAEGNFDSLEKLNLTRNKYANR